MRRKLVTPKDLKPGDVVFHADYPVEVISCQRSRDGIGWIVVWGYGPSEWAKLSHCERVSVALLMPEQIAAIENVNAEWLGKEAQGNE